MTHETSPPSDASVTDIPVPSGSPAGPPVPASLRAEEAQADEATEGAPSEPQVRADDQSRVANPYSQYVSVAALPAYSQVGIATAGLVANHVSGAVTIAPRIRVHDVLSGAPVDRTVIRNDRSYVKAQEWVSARKEAVRALSANGVIIVVAPRGYGSTTFSLQLLACHAPEGAELIRLEADWRLPRVGKLPLQKDCAYQMDMQDTEHDLFDGAFLSGLGKYSADLKALGSCLILTVADVLWPGYHGYVPDTVGVVWLDDPPDAMQLVEQHLIARGLSLLVPYVQQAGAAKHVRGRNAVQALRAVDVVAEQWREHRRQQNADGDSLVVEVDSSRPQQLNPDLKQSIEQALGDWQDDLDNLFGEPQQSPSNGLSLSPEDRCLLISLAMHQAGTATEIESGAFTLEQALDKSRQVANKNAADTWDVFSRRGLRPRLRAFHATIDGRDRVTFNRPGYAEAVLAYVWENYSGLRDDLVAWMVKCSPADSQRTAPAVETLTALILRLQDADRLASLRDSAIDQKCPEVIVHVMSAAALDEHMGRRTRSLLYDWSSLRPETQHIVVAVCRELIQVKTDAALVRLRRVAINATDASVCSEVLAVLRDVAADRQMTGRFAEAVAEWHKADPASRAAKLGLLALLATESDGVPWFPSHPTAIDLAGGIRALLADLDSFPETVTVLVAWLKACARDDAAYANARTLMVDAARDRHAFNAGMKLMEELKTVETPDGSNVGEDLYANLVQPKLRFLSPLTRSEI
jgi:hypothetical protein